MSRKSQVKIDEFAFVLLAGLVLMVIFMWAWTQPPASNATTTPGGEEMLRVVYEPSEFSIKYAIGVTTLASKENVEASSGLFSSKDVSLTVTLDEERLGEIKECFLVIDVDTSNALAPLVVEVNGQEVYRNTVKAGTLMIPVKKELFYVGNNLVVIRAEFPGISQFWKTNSYSFKEVKLQAGISGVFTKKFEFWLDKLQAQYFKYGKLQYTVVDRKGNGKLEVRLNGQLLEKGLALIGEHEKVFGEGLVKEGRNVLTFSTEPDTEYTIKDVVLTISYLKK